MELLQLAMPDTEREVVAATFHAMSAMDHFVQHIQQDRATHHKLAMAAASAVQAGNRSDGMQVHLWLHTTAQKFDLHCYDVLQRCMKNKCV